MRFLSKPSQSSLKLFDLKRSVVLLLVMVSVLLASCLLYTSDAADE